MDVVKRSRRHLVAVNRSIRAGDLGAVPSAQPIVELVRDLARLMDAQAGVPPLSLASAYLSALKDLRREVAQSEAASAGAMDEPVRGVRAASEPDELEVFKRRKGAGAAG